MIFIITSEYRQIIKFNSVIKLLYTFNYLQTLKNDISQFNNYYIKKLKPQNRLNQSIKIEQQKQVKKLKNILKMAELFGTKRYESPSFLNPLLWTETGNRKPHGQRSINQSFF
ncbi:hypothetical protein SS50377_22383 [Spironucleus salmonicida]|uniref:Uncharacterized protein n=1 Tax=Spironucleus salmonicida TaxID=348837 RepID=V6LCC4_9EUKA|nr:hypothetical protein SS50377_22383 [Spironucleus salmonicida]|eukprot:EST42122.1 Hypothetical protein SS50377_ee009 [Spironucleus salmonicida]